MRIKNPRVVRFVYDPCIPTGLFVSFPAKKQRDGSQLSELQSTNADAWAKESFEIATKIAYRNGGQIGISKGGNKDCRDVQTAPVLPAGYVVNAGY
jgi:hypothetical protein